MISRRDFVKRAAAGAVGVATVGILGGCTQGAASTSNEVKWDKEADVVIVGGGGTGLAAALQAALDGAKVLTLEKGGVAGGPPTFPVELCRQRVRMPKSNILPIRMTLRRSTISCGLKPAKGRLTKNL